MEFSTKNPSAIKYFDACNTTLIIQLDQSGKNVIITMFQKTSTGDLIVNQEHVAIYTFPRYDLNLTFSSEEGNCNSFEFMISQKQLYFKGTTISIFDCWLKTLDCVAKHFLNTIDLRLEDTIKNIIFGGSRLTIFDRSKLNFINLNGDPTVSEVYPLTLWQGLSDIISYLYFKGDYYVVTHQGIYYLRFVVGGISQDPNYVFKLSNNDTTIVQAKAFKNHILLTVEQSQTKAQTRYFIEPVSNKKSLNMTRPSTQIFKSHDIDAFTVDYIDEFTESAIDEHHYMNTFADYDGMLLFIGSAYKPVVMQSMASMLDDRSLASLNRPTRYRASTKANKFDDVYEAKYQAIMAIGNRWDKDLYHLVVTSTGARLSRLVLSSPVLDCSLADAHWLMTNNIELTLFYRMQKGMSELLPVDYHVSFVDEENTVRKWTVIVCISVAICLVVWHIKYCLEKIIEAKNPKEYYPEFTSNTKSNRDTSIVVDID